MDDLGIASHSVVIMAAAIHAGDLMQVLPQWTGRETSVYCVRPQRRMGLAATIFIEYLAARWRGATPSIFIVASRNVSWEFGRQRGSAI